MSQKITKTLIALVKDEAKKLRKLALPKEKDKLKIKSLDSGDRTRCIYGQMTGNCNSERAGELIVNCAKRVYNTAPISSDILRLSKLNGKPKKIDFNDDDRTWKYISPIEKFIWLNDNVKGGKKENNEILVDYLKGKTKTLKFK